MRSACRLALATIAITAAVFAVILGASGAGNNADNFAIDLDITGNTATELGTREECREVTPGSTITIDVTATNVPAAKAAFAFAFQIDYNPAVFSFVLPRVWDTGFLSTDPNYSGINADDSLPDTDGAYHAAVANIAEGAEGVSGSGFLERLTVAIDAGAAPGGYLLTLRNASHTAISDGKEYKPDALLGARIAVGVTCAEIGIPRVWGDVDCSGSFTLNDGRKIVVKSFGGNPAKIDPTCPTIGDTVSVDGIDRIWGDVDCSGSFTLNDGRKIVVKSFGGQPAKIDPTCPDIGVPVLVQ